MRSPSATGHPPAASGAYPTPPGNVRAGSGASSLRSHTPPGLLRARLHYDTSTASEPYLTPWAERARRVSHPAPAGTPSTYCWTGWVWRLYLGQAASQVATNVEARPRA